MTHPGMNSPRLSDMRQALDEAVISDRDRRALERALAEVETTWTTRKQDAYAKAVQARDAQHDALLAEARTRQDEVYEAYEALRNGRLSVQEARAGLRDIYADHARLVDQHRGIEASEQRLAEHDAMKLDDYQAAQFDRFPLTANSAPTLAQVWARSNTGPVRTPRMSPEQINAGQDELIRALAAARRR